MYWISKLMSAFIIPPGLFALSIAGIIVALYLKREKLARILGITTLSVLYLLAIEPVADGLILPLENRHEPYRAAEDVDIDFIVVLGSGTVEHSPEYGGRTVLAPNALRKVDYAIDLHYQTGLPLIFSGGVSNRPVPGASEADAALTYSTKRGLDPGMLNVEATSRNTDENASETARLYSPRSVLLVTSAFHMPRSMLIFDQHGMDPVAAPTDYRAGRAGYGFLSFLPHRYSLYTSSIAVKEYVGLTFYRLLGIFRN